MTKLPTGKMTEYGQLIQYKGEDFEFHRVGFQWMCHKIYDGALFKRVKQGKQEIVDKFSGDLEHIEEAPANTEISPLWDCAHPAALLTLRVHSGNGQMSKDERKTLDHFGYLNLDGTIDVEYARRELDRVARRELDRVLMTTNQEVVDDCETSGN